MRHGYLHCFSNKHSFFNALALFAVALLSLSLSPNVHGQIIYAVGNDDNGQQYMYKINLTTCTFCAVTPPSPNIGVSDVVLLPNGNHLHITGNFTNGLKRLLPPPSTQVVWQANNPQSYYTGQLAPNGLVYLAGLNGLGTLDPATDNVTYLGNWPNSFNSVVDLYYVNGILYGTALDIPNGNPILVQIDVNDPSQSTIVGPLFVTNGAEGGIWNGSPGLFYIDLSFDIYFYDPITENSTLICDIPPGVALIGLSFPPAGLPEYDCIVTCTTDAGTLPQGGPYNTCTNATLTFPAATGTVLDANDLLRYILFTNPSDTAGSIVATSATPSFVFDPATMQTGTTYYIAAMAGDELNGNVDLDDPCLDFSNALQVVWRPLPSVAFSLAGSPDVCTGDCRTVTATFTGTPPFTLAYTTPEGNFTQTVAGNTGSFQVCVPTGTPPGALTVQVTGLTDAWCACP